jgi:hypothetical protein
MVATRHNTMSRAIAADLAPRAALHWWGVAHGAEHRGRPEAAPHFRRPRGPVMAPSILRTPSSSEGLG